MPKEYLRLYTHWDLMNVTVNEQIAYNYCLPYAFKLKHEQNVETFWVEMRRATGRESAEHMIRPANSIPTSSVEATNRQLLIIKHTLCKVLKMVEEWRKRGMVGKRRALVCMSVLIEGNELIVFHIYIFIWMVAWLGNSSHRNEFQNYQSMSLYAQWTMVQLKEIIDDKKITGNDSTEVQVQLVDAEEVLDPDNCGSVMDTVFDAINYELAHGCQVQAARLLHAHLIRQSEADQVPCNKYSIL